MEFLVGHLEHDANAFVLIRRGQSRAPKVVLAPDELWNIRRVAGALIPI
jgi:hypothetical protein